MRKICFALLFCLGIGFIGQDLMAAAPASDATDQKSETTKKKRRKKRRSLVKEEEYKGSGLNFKLIPAFYWASMGIEAEKPISENITVNLGFQYRLNSFETLLPGEAKDASNGNQYMLELGVKYYFDKTPKGWYAMGQVNSSNMCFADGTTRPFAAFGQGKSQDDINTPAVVLAPGSLRFGLGGGYQGIVIRRNLVANIGAGLQFYSDTKGTHANLYMTPSFGYIF